MKKKKGISDLCSATHEGRGKWAGGVITITSATQPKAILLPLFQLSSCHLQSIMHFGFFYAIFFSLVGSGGDFFFFTPSPLPTPHPPPPSPTLLLTMSTGGI